MRTLTDRSTFRPPPDSSGDVPQVELLWSLTQPTNVSEKPHFPAGYPSGYSWLQIIVASVVVTVIILVIVMGNLMVIWAIVRENNLRGVQNYFIGSLALADFLVGLIIVPFALANELMGYWPFGKIFCELWKAMDVLLCTASIYSLCLISLDRYWSITKATYNSRQRTAKRAAVMIFIAWFISTAVCVPPLMGWTPPQPDSDWPVCVLSEDIGYVLYSSMGSFYIPAFITVFAYFKIYQTVKVRSRKNLSKTLRPMQGEKSKERKCTESSSTVLQLLSKLQIQQQQQRTTAPNVNDLVTETKVVQTERNPMQSSVADETEEATIISDCRHSNDILDIPLSATPSSVHKEPGFRTRSQPLPCQTADADELAKITSVDINSDGEALYSVILNHIGRHRFFFHSMPAVTTATTTTTTADNDSLIDQPCMESCQQQQQPPSNHSTILHDTAHAPSPGAVHTPISDTATARENGTVQQFQILEPTENGNTTNISLTLADKDCSLQRQWSQNNGKVVERNKSNNAEKVEELKSPPKKNLSKKIRHDEDFSFAEIQKRILANARERRANKVLGLVLASFILCWLPFFLVYVISAFCYHCIPFAVSNIFFWIGYCNSALNPIIYTVFNRDFRKAFRRILFDRRHNHWQTRS